MNHEPQGGKIVQEVHTTSVVTTVVPQAQDVQEEATHSFVQVVEPIPSLNAPVLGNIGPFSVATSSMTVLFITVIVAVLCLLAFFSKRVPGKVQGLFEMLYEAITHFIASIVGEDRAKNLVPFVGALMVYLLIANLLPMLPGISGVNVLIDGEHTPLFRGATTDFNTTFGLALAIVATMQVVGMKEQGIFGYLSHFIQIKQVIKGFKKGFGEGMVAVIGFLVGLIEIISELAKTLSLSLRLFGNLFAHEVLTVILLGAFAYGVPAIWMGMGVLVGIVQSIVFTALVSVYYSLVLKKEGKGHGH